MKHSYMGECVAEDNGSMCVFKAGCFDGDLSRSRLPPAVLNTPIHVRLTKWWEETEEEKGQAGGRKTKLLDNLGGRQVSNQDITSRNVCFQCKTRATFESIASRALCFRPNLTLAVVIEG